MARLDIDGIVDEINSAHAAVGALNAQFDLHFGRYKVLQLSIHDLVVRLSALPTEVQSHVCETQV